MAKRQRKRRRHAARRLADTRDSPRLHRRPSRRGGQARDRPRLRHHGRRPDRAEADPCQDWRRRACSRASRKRLERPGDLAPVTVLEITARDRDGDFWRAPPNWAEAADGPAADDLDRASRKGRDSAPPASATACSPDSTARRGAAALHGARHQAPRQAQAIAVLGVVRIADGGQRHRAGRPQAPARK